MAISGFTACYKCCDRPDVINMARAGPRSRKLWHTAGSKRRSLLIAGDNDEIFMTKSLNVTPKTTERYSIARSDKSVAYVTNNKSAMPISSKMRWYRPTKKQRNVILWSPLRYDTIRYGLTWYGAYGKQLARLIFHADTMISTAQR